MSKSSEILFPVVLREQDGKLIKQPKHKGWTKLTESENIENSKYVGCLTGEKTNMTVLDFDNNNNDNNINGVEWLEQYEKEHGKINTQRVKTVSGGVHLYFNYDERLNNVSKVVDGANIDIRNRGGFVVRPNGDDYKWVEKNTPLIDVPEQLLDKINSRGRKDKQTVKPKKELKKDTKKREQKEQKQNSILNILENLKPSRCDCYSDWITIGKVIKNELDDITVWDTYSRKSKKYNSDDILKKWETFTNNNNFTIDTLKLYIRQDENITNDDVLKVFNNWEEVEISKYFMELYCKDFIIVNDVCYRWNGVYWDSNQAENHIQDLLKNNYYELLETKINSKNYTENEELKKEHLKMIKILKRVTKIKDIMKDLKKNLSLRDKDIKLDTEDHIFCFKNKVFDLVNKQWVEPNRNHYLTTTTDYEYKDYTDKEVKEFNELLDKIFPDPELKDCYLTLLSTALSGEQLDRFIMANGSGGNGKSVINELMSDTLGKYFYRGNCDSLQSSKATTGGCPELANMNGKRMVIFSEADSKSSLKSNMVKKLTGDKNLNSRMLFTNNCDIKLSCTIFLECNKKPLFDENTEALRRRIIDIPFVSTFYCTSTQKHLEKLPNCYPRNSYYKTDEFREKTKCILFDVLTEYYYKYYSIDNKQINVPEFVSKRAEEYLNEGDELLSWFNSVFVMSENEKDYIQFKDIYSYFKNSQYYNNMSKKDKRMMNSKYLISLFKENIELKHYYKETHQYTNDDGEKICRRSVLMGFKIIPDDDDNKYTQIDL